MKTTNEVYIYSKDGVTTTIGDTTKLIVKNVWNKNRFVEIQIGDGQKVVVKASELNKAIQISTNNED